VVCALAEAKAAQVAGELASLNNGVAANCVDYVVIGCDSMLYIDGRLCGKPQSVAEARDLWQSMAGRAGNLYTGHCVVRLLDHKIVHSSSESSNTTVHFGRPSPEDLERTWPVVSRCRSPADSPLTASAAGSSMVSTATRRPWWGSGCP